jgi:pyrimidine operon attenuation protein/uracil phosphoribosyltransferase
MPTPNATDTVSSIDSAEVLVARLVATLKPVVTANTVMIGIHTGGAWIAQKLHAALGIKAPLGTLDISFYRDDFDRIGLNPNVKPSTIGVDLNDKRVLLVDDVLFTGRTVRAAMNELFDYGRPERIDLVCLVDRGGRELPVAAQYVGATLALPAHQSLNLARDAQGTLAFTLVEKPAAPPR